MTGKNQGEGDRESARRYNDDTRRFAKSGKAEPAARAATRDDAAERKGRARAKAFDPAVHRDYGKAEK